MTELQSTTPCPDAEILAELAEGKVKRHELPPLLEHLQTCARCSRAVRGANEELQQPATRSPWWLAVAAIAVVALVAVPFVVRQLRSTSIETLVELSPRAARVVEPRLSGGFDHAPWRGPNRAEGSAFDAAQLKLFGAAGDLVERATKEPSAATQHDAGVALTVIGKPLDAVDRLRDAAARDGSNARTWSDLAAAQYSAALQLGRASLYPEALASADHALRIDPLLAEARFNRALILEKLGLSDGAREAWQRYLEVDAGSQWAVEARERLAKLPATTGDASFRSRDLPLLERAVATNDRARVERLVAQYRQQARTFAEAEHLGLWGEAVLRGDVAEASRLRDVARAVGDALVRVNGESLLRDAVSSIDGASLAEAHATYRRGRMLYGKQQPSAAEPELRRAAALFAAAKSPMTLVARYFAASTRYDQNDVDTAERELAAILDDAPTEYIALRAQVQWQLALCRMSQDDWSGALPLVEEAAAAFQRLGERSNEGFVKTLVADALMCTGRPDDAWNARIESFRILSAEGRGSRLPVSIGGAVRMELRAARFESARALLRLEIATTKNDVLLTNALVREAVLSTVLGERASADEAANVAQGIDDDALRARALIDADFARGAVTLPSDPRNAEIVLTRAIDGYARIEKPLFLPECHLLRARARERTGDTAGAAADLEQGIVQLERHRVDYPGAVVGTGILDAGRALFREAALLAMDRNDAAAAFAYAERSRAQIGSAAATAAEIQKRLIGSDAVVLEIFGSHVFCVTERAFKVARVVLPNTEDRKQLYDGIIRPFENEIASARHLIIVSDPLLDGVPFSALYDSDSRTHLVERVPVSLALSASSLQPRARVRPRAVVAVGLPSGEAAGSMALPRIASELNEVRSLYPRAIDTTPSPTFREIAATAGVVDVVHIAGHTERGSGAGESGLRFADREWASWRSIAASRFPPSSTIVLAACETLRHPRSSQTFALSIGGGFLAAGAGDVIGTLDVIPDGDAHDLFKAIHRELARGASADEAVRAAQIEALQSARGVQWQVIAVLTRHIPIRTERSEASWQRSLSTSLESARTSVHSPRRTRNIG